MAPKPPLMGTSLLYLATYWYLVYRFEAWTVGIVAFVIAFLVNVIHSLVRSKEEKPA